MPARILSVELTPHRGSKSTTYEATASYRYEFAGTSHLGHRVGLRKGGDNMGDWQDRAYREFLPYTYSGRPYHAYVNPANPAQAVLFRDFRWSLAGMFILSALLFGGAGSGMIALGFIGRRRLQREGELQARYPEEPWQHREDWAAGQVRSSAQPTLILSTVFATFWNLIPLPLLFMLPGEVLEKGNRLALIGLIFPAAGLGLIVWAVRNIIRVRKFGSPTLQLETLPGVIGGSLAGVVRTGRPLRPEQGFALVLDGINRRTTGAGKSRSTQERILHQQTLTVPLEQIGQDATGSTIPLRFAIRFDAPPTNHDDADNAYLWRVSVAAEVPGVDYAANFEVPVFRTAASHADPAPAATPAATTADSDLLNSGGLRVRQEDGSLVVTLAAAQNKVAALGLTAFLALWTGFAALLWLTSSPA